MRSVPWSPTDGTYLFNKIGRVCPRGLRSIARTQGGPPGLRRPYFDVRDGARRDMAVSIFLSRIPACRIPACRMG